MTAFARVQAMTDEFTLCWEIKSVNHRYLDLSFRIPEAWRFLENDLRKEVRQQLSRGKIDCQLKCHDAKGLLSSLVINENLVDTLLEKTGQLAASRHLQNDITMSFLLNWPGVVMVEEADKEQLSKKVLQLFIEAVADLNKARSREGDELKIIIHQRLQELQALILEARKLSADNVLAFREKLVKRLDALAFQVDASRIEQEIALLLLKMDVSEELDRLTSHVKEVDHSLTKNPAAGRRLDFLMQELHREANTLSAKSDSTALTQCAVEMKVLIEQMREQIQNIE